MRLTVAACISFLLVAASLVVNTDAQRLYVPVKISSVSSQASATGTVVTIVADGALSRAQTWHDDEGYHLVLPNTVSDYSLKLVRGVKVRRVGSSLEILLQTKPGSRVSLQSANNQMSLAVEGKLVARGTDSPSHADSSSAEERRLFEDPQYARPQQDAAPLKLSSTVEDLSLQSRPTASDAPQASTAQTESPESSQAGSDQIVPQGDGSRAPNAPKSQIKVQGEDESVLASVFSGTSVFIIVILGLFGLLVSRKLRSRQEPASTSNKNGAAEAEWEGLDTFAANAQGLPQSESKSLVKAGDAASNGSSRQAVARMAVAGPASLYGAYRIDQEVGKLILGQPHRIDVLASRATDDRRAIETSLIKGVNSPQFDEVSKRRAREALEEYGFVARQCAALLLSPDAFDRSSAARSLGEIKSPAALPFLLESLYDSESIVRNQAVVSIGELKLPSAIGALLDIARTHPDVPSGLLSRTLSACSVEGLDFFDAVPETSLLGPGDIGSVIEEITHLEPATSVENLPEASEDERLVQAMSSIRQYRR